MIGLLTFPPSTPAFMVKFKAENASAIQKARLDLDRKIKSELDAFEKKTPLTEAHGKEESKVNKNQNVSPTNNTAM